jgi:prepilin-type processing-associated H-X9-DG protein
MTHPALDDAWLRRYEEVLREIREELKRLREQTLPILESPVPAEVGVLAGALATIVLVKLREALTTVDAFCDQVATLLQYESIPVRFAGNATSWYKLERSVSAPGKDLLQKAAAIRLTWQGKAADAYLGADAAQSVATERLAAAGAATADALVGGAEAAGAFFVALLLLLASGAAQLSIAADAVRSVIRLPAALSALGTAIDIFGGLNGLLDATRASFRRRATDVQAISGTLLDVAVFPDGMWPRSGNALYADGSVTDGDPSDWSVRRTPSIPPHLPR